jgi:hypothetical protein
MKDTRWKRFLWFFLSGALLGTILSNWLGPRMVAWYFDPPVNIGVNCREATEWAMSRLQVIQFGGTLGFAVLALLAFSLLFRSRVKEDRP